MVEDYLNIIDNIIEIASIIDVEIDQKIEEVPTDFTNGSIPFAEGGFLTEDNSYLFWDNTNKRLGVGTNAPSQKVDVNGEIKADTMTANDLNASELVLTDTSKKLESGGTVYDLKQSIIRRSYFYARSY